MRVLMQLRSTAHGGGEATQVRETAAGLRARGVQVDVTDALAADLTGIDLVHVFGLTQPSEPLLQAEHAREHGVPVVLSPVYVDFSEYNRQGRYGLAAVAYRLIRSDGFVEGLKQAVRLRHAAGRRAPLARLLAVPFEEQQRRLLSRASMLLPNSKAESVAIADRFRYSGDVRVVSYAASTRFTHAVADDFIARTSLRDFVIAVGFITSLKNQLRLIAALENTGLHLVIVGSPVPTHRAYYRAVCREASRRRYVTMLGYLPHEQLGPALAAARVVALPSWFETCGMAGLEGALAGCRVAITNRGYTREYFGDDASYCDPSSIASIRGAILEAMERPVPETLQQKIRTDYTWDRAVDATLDAYRALVSRV